jgi:FixJ family two-component response regulator
MNSEQVVAVIDDDSTVLKAIVRLLNIHGFRSQSFASAEAFLDHSGPGGPGCLVLDIHLGGMSGIDLAVQLKAHGRQLPIVFITAVDSEAVRREATEVGCVAFLRKPFSAELLIGAIGKAIGSIGPHR